jgi:hypothetical protein
MGFLTEGDTLPWSDAKQFAEYIRTHGIEQFLSIYFRTKERTNDALLWGDEVCDINAYLVCARFLYTAAGKHTKEVLLASLINFGPL